MVVATLGLRKIYQKTLGYNNSGISLAFHRILNPCNADPEIL